MYADISKKHGFPAIVHVHVAMKAGMLALYLKSKYRIPFVVSEHWTGYYKESNPNINTIGNTLKSLIKKVIQQASQVFPVSADLGKKICETVALVPFEVIPNVVDTRIFNYKAANVPIFRFIHPSYLNYQKNPEGMIEAANLLAQKGYQFELVLLGNKKAELESLAKQKGLFNTHVFIKDFVSYSEVANQMQQSAALLMFSRFENLPCVVLEALCCGLPVISTPVGGIAEVINESNGLLVNNEDVEGLANAMKKMIDDYSAYNKSQIADEAAKKFSYAVVGAKYNEWYNKIIARK
jgi:glycosyltransferase involved in cell wall biosynthesis